MEYNLAGRKVIVTGAGDGIGRELALAFGRAGARVAGCARNAERMELLSREMEGYGHFFCSADMARAEEVMIYTIGLESNYFNGIRQVRSRPDGRLKTFAEETGGGYFELKDTDELGSTVTRVAQELHSQYVLGFVPSVRDGKVHELDVRVAQRGTTARARRSYIAPSE